MYMGFPGGSEVKNPANAGDTGDPGSIPERGRSSGGGNGNSLQYSCLGNPIDRGTWRASVCGVAKSQTQLSVHAAIRPQTASDCTRCQAAIRPQDLASTNPSSSISLFF